MLKRGTEAAILVAVLIASSTCAAQHGSSIVHNGLLFEIETDAAIYNMYGPVSIGFSVTNVTEDPIPLTLLCLGGQGKWHELRLRIFPPFGPIVWWDPTGCYWMDLDDVLEPGASYSKDSVWDMVHTVGGGHITTAGRYTIKGDLFAEGYEHLYTVDLEISILHPTSSVSVDLAASWSTIKALYR